ncbi:MAG: glycosyltransferase [Geminicoccaceae bacterium]
MIVVDDGSPEPVEPVVAKANGRLHVTCLRQENAGPAKARNRGAAAAQGQYLAFTDDDCRPEPTWLERLIAPLKDRPDALVGGQTVNLLTDNVYAEASQDLVSFLYDYALRHGRGLDFFTSNNMACRKDRFAALGGFDETFPLAAAEDRDFGLRWKEQGWPLIHAPGAVVGHLHALSLARFWRQQANYGRGARHLRVRMADRDGRKVPFEGLRFYARMAHFPFREGRPNAALRTCLLGLSQVAMVAGFADERFRRRRGNHVATKP